MSTAERTTTLILAAMASAYFLLLLLPSLSPHYGFYSDELYYLACADRLAFGFVDHPPLFPLVLRLHRELFGDSLVALRVLPTAAGALTTFLTGWMAGRLGGGRFAQVLAALATMVSGGSLVLFSWFSVNCLEILVWTGACWVLLERCRSDELRLWVALGAVLGLALLNKHTSAVLIAGLGVAIAATPLRRDLRGPWPWIGALVALGLFSPNLFWQAAHGWPSLAFYREVAAANLATSPLTVLAGQVETQNPATLPVWACGAYYFLRSPDARRYRALGWLFVIVLAIAMVGGQSRPDRIAGIFPLVFAGGAVFLERVRRPRASPLRRLWNTYTLPAFMVATGVAAATLVLPVLPPPTLARHPLYDADEGSGWRTEYGRNEIPYHLGNRTHWKAFVSKVAEVYRGLSPPQSAQTLLLADYFGHAGALEYYGREHGLPAVYSPHTGYYLWGPPPGEPETLISIGIDEALLRASFEDVRVAAVFRCSYCPPWVDDLPIHVASRPRRAISELWRNLGRIGGMSRRERLLREQESRRSPGATGESSSRGSVREPS